MCFPQDNWECETKKKKITTVSEYKETLIFETFNILALIYGIVTKFPPKNVLLLFIVFKFSI
jgi:hypothetical protein